MGKIGFAKRIRAYFLTGLLVLVPLGLTYSIIKLLFLAIDDILSDTVSKYVLETFGFQLGARQIPGIGIAALLIIIVVTGVVARNYFGKKLVDLGDQTLQKIPLINRVYSATKQISQAFFSPTHGVIKKPILFEFPRKGMYSIGFYTQDARGPLSTALGKDFATIFLPTTPNPTTGYLLIVPKSELIELDLSIEDALKVVISGGILSPSETRNRKSNASSHASDSVS